MRLSKLAHLLRSFRKNKKLFNPFMTKAVITTDDLYWILERAIFQNTYRSMVTYMDSTWKFNKGKWNITWSV